MGIGGDIAPVISRRRRLWHGPISLRSLRLRSPAVYLSTTYSNQNKQN